MTFFWIFEISWLKHPPPKSGDSRAPLGLRRTTTTTTTIIIIPETRQQLLKQAPHPGLHNTFYTDTYPMIVVEAAFVWRQHFFVITHIREEATRYETSFLVNTFTLIIPWGAHTSRLRTDSSWTAPASKTNTTKTTATPPRITHHPSPLEVSSCLRPQVAHPCCKYPGEIMICLSSSP